MEDKQLTTQESLDLISKMIENTRRNFNNKSSGMFLIWGGTSAVVSLAVLLAVKITGNYLFFNGWWAIPVAGGILSWFHYRSNSKRISTHMDKIVGHMWLVTGVLCGAVPLAGNLLPLREPIQILFTVALLISAATAVTGFVIKYKPVIAGGAAGLALSFAIPTIVWEWQIAMFAGVFLVAQVIPGLMLNAAYRNKKTRGDV